MDKQVKILLVEDEPKMRDLIKIAFKKERFETYEAVDGKQALNLFKCFCFDLIILDVMLPEIDGWTVCREIRRTSNLPIIMLTARGEEFDKLFGFELGADDYIVKPFSPREVMLRVAAILKRTKVDEPETLVISYPNFEIHPDSRLVLAEGEPLTLTPKEFELILHLAQNPEKVFTRETLLKEVWRYDYFGDLRTVDTHIKRLREKLQQKSSQVAKMIVTVWGTGYKFSPLNSEGQH